MSTLITMGVIARGLWIVLAAGLLLSYEPSASAEDFLLPTLQVIKEQRQYIGEAPAETLQLARVRREKIKISGKGASLALALQDWVIASALIKLDRANLARGYITEGLAISYKYAPNSSLVGELLIKQAYIAFLDGNVQQYTRDYQKAFLQFQQSNNARGQAVALQNMAGSYLDAGDYSAALKYCYQTLAIYTDNDDIAYSVYNNMGIALSGLAKPKLAEVAFEQALVVARKKRDIGSIDQVTANIIRSQLDQNDVAAARKTLVNSYDYSRFKITDEWRPAFYGLSARVYLKLSNVPGALSFIKAAFKQKKMNRDSSLRDLHETAYQVYRAAGDNSKALAHLEAFKGLDDKARALTASTNAALMSARFDFANQDLKITRLRAGQAERDAALARTQGRFHSLLLSGLAFITVLLALGFVSIRRSRNQVRAANRELQGSNADLQKALAAKGEFLATTSHEIRTPLNGILGMTQVLLADRAVEPDVRARVQLIHGAGETMRALVDDILDMAKMERGELRLHPAPMDLRRLLEETAAVWTGQAQTKRIGLVVQLDDCPVDIVADEVRLRQIMFNLLSNAIKFTDRGQVRLAATVAPADGDATEALVVTVADSGIGIPPDRLAEIFESFRQVDGGVTRRHGGTGLGLAICRSLARAMGGDVGVASVPGAGSTFTLRLPLERTTRPAAATPVAATAATLGEARLLLLEPNPLAQGIVRALLTPQVRALEVVAEAEAAAALLDAGGIQHLLADAAAFGFDAAAALRFVAAHPVAHATVLWPSPDAGVEAAFAAVPGVRLVAKPVGAPDLLAGLRMGYQGGMADRDIAA